MFFSRIGADGTLHVDINNQTFSFKNEEFCLVFTDIHNDESQDELQLKAAYYFCYNQNPEEIGDQTGDQFSSVFYPVSVFISSSFVLLTIIIYILIHDLRKNLFGKLTLGFLFNVFIFYFTAGIHHSMSYSDPQLTFRGSLGCILIGYILQHTYVAILFWTNVMAYTISKTFSNVLLQSQTSESFKKVLLSMIYAQGMPLILTFVTIVMDQYGSREDFILPNMGVYSCQVGSEFNFYSSFLETAQFLYFYLIIIIVTAVNIIFLIMTAYYFISHWLSTQSVFCR